MKWEIGGLGGSSETSSVACELSHAVHALQQRSHPNPPQPINKHLTGTEIQYREQR